MAINKFLNSLIVFFFGLYFFSLSMSSLIITFMRSTNYWYDIFTVFFTACPFLVGLISTIRICRWIAERFIGKSQGAILIIQICLGLVTIIAVPMVIFSLSIFLTYSDGVTRFALIPSSMGSELICLCIGLLLCIFSFCKMLK